MATLKHRVYDTDTHFIIDPVSRTMKNESTGKTRLIQGDHNSERFTFQIPRTIEGHDMTLCDKVEVHFTNTDVKTKQESRDFTTVEDLQVSPDGDDVVIFSWLIKKTATKYEGTLDISVLFACTDDQTGEEVYTWNTFPFSNISVAKGQRNSAAIVEESLDILEQWRKELFELKPKLFLRYSEFSNGSAPSAKWKPGMNYVGLCVGTTAPTDPAAYTWLLFKGENGITPHIDQESGHWMLGKTDTGWLAGVYEGGSGGTTDPDEPGTGGGGTTDPDEPGTGGGGTTEPDEPDTPTPSAYTIYCGSMRTTDAITAANIKSKCAGTYGTSTTSQFEGGCDRFLIAFQANYDSLQVIDTTPTFGGDATSECEYYGKILIDGISYKVYAWDTVRVLTSGYPLAISIS